MASVTTVAVKVQEEEELEDPPWKKEVHVPVTAKEKQKARVEKLMKRADKPVFIPERPKEREPRKPPEFIRHVWGSAWGAGSGDFHIYRGIRRREGIRQKYREEQAIKEQANTEYLEKLEKNKQEEAKRVDKRKAKRLRNKRAKQLAKRKKKVVCEESESSDDSGVSDEEEERGSSEAVEAQGAPLHAAEAEDKDFSEVVETQGAPADEAEVEGKEERQQ